MNSILRRRRALMAVGGSATILPAEYQQVEWVGNEDVGPKISLSYGNIGSFSFTLVAEPVNYGATSQIKYACIGRSMYSTLENDWGIIFRSASTVASNGDNVAISNSSISGGVFTVDGVVSVPTSPGNFVLFRPVSIGTAKSKIYRFTMLNNGTVIHDFIPCYRKTDSVIGMYDIVSGSFYTNIGTGTFTKGADV